MLKKFEQFNRQLSSWAAWIGFGAIFFMVLLTCVDVIGAKIFKAPIFGALDIMMLAQLISTSFAAAMALILGRHVQVEFFMPLFPKRVQIIVDILIYFICLAFFILIVWRLFMHGLDLQIGGEESDTARIPIAPFTYASAIAIIPVCLIFLQKLLNSILRMMKNES